MDETIDHHIKRNKPNSERQHHMFSHIQNVNKKKRNESTMQAVWKEGASRRGDKKE
jgi:hypothetical protein